MQDRVWRTRDGRLMLVSQMATSHIQASLDMIDRSGGRWRAAYRDRLQLELDIRRLGLSSRRGQRGE